VTIRTRALTLMNRALRQLDLRLVISPRELADDTGGHLDAGVRHAISAKILERLEAGDEFQFLQIGAHDASGAAEPAELSGRVRRRGVLVEPQPYFANRLRDRFRGDAGIQVLECAVGDAPGDCPFFVVDDPSGTLPEWTTQIASFSRTHVEQFSAQVPEIRSRIREMRVDVVTTKDICDRAGIDRLDLLMVDVEGWDWQVLRSFPFETVPVGLVVFEHGHLCRADRRAAVRRLMALGFRVQLLHANAIASAPSAG
jgi:FkbM family methyltransferase